MLAKKTKDKVVKKHQTSEKDTGSPEVQVALLSQRIEELSGHLTKHKKDDHSRRGLIGMVAQRRKLLNYLQKKDDKRYGKLVKDLGLKK
jgi:small subunit ribosomal protein S15